MPAKARLRKGSGNRESALLFPSSGMVKLHNIGVFMFSKIAIDN